MLFILLIKYYSSEILSYVHQYSQVIHIQVMEEGVQWLMGFPLGLKTNDNLNKVIGYIVIQGILFWEYCTIYFISIQEMLIQVWVRVLGNWVVWDVGTHDYTRADFGFD
jgi:hypothetical protein